MPKCVKYPSQPFLFSYANFTKRMLMPHRWPFVKHSQIHTLHALTELGHREAVDCSLNGFVCAFKYKCLCFKFNSLMNWSDHISHVFAKSRRLCLSAQNRGWCAGDRRFRRSRLAASGPLLPGVMSHATFISQPPT